MIKYVHVLKKQSRKRDLLFFNVGNDDVMSYWLVPADRKSYCMTTDQGYWTNLCNALDKVYSVDEGR